MSFQIVATCIFATISAQDFGASANLCRVIRAILFVLLVLAMFGVLPK